MTYLHLLASQAAYWVNSFAQTKSSAEERNAHNALLDLCIELSIKEPWFEPMSPQYRGYKGLAITLFNRLDTLTGDKNFRPGILASKKVRVPKRNSPFSS